MVDATEEDAKGGRDGALKAPGELPLESGLADGRGGGGSIAATGPVTAQAVVVPPVKPKGFDAKRSKE
ncbi:hypothetical protein, partial [Streptomyces wuyuanensis]|uniref:hypothetical protein n=1 Tax=Streptomyces wuyuanensis TaxID=1196353 RepID=UPI003D724145